MPKGNTVIKRNTGKVIKISDGLIKYLTMQLMYRGLDTGLISDVVAISDYMIPAYRVDENIDDAYANAICVSSEIKKKASEDMGISENDFSHIIYKLTKYKLLIPMVKANGKKVRTYYYVSNWIPRRDEWSYVDTLGQKGNPMTQRAREAVCFAFNGTARHMETS